MDYPRLAHDGYHTIDSLAVETLARGFDLRDRRVWEPCAGIGHLVRQLEEHGAIVMATELHRYPGQSPHILTSIDFLKTPRSLADTIVMNPPYEQASAFIRHALFLLPQGWVAVLLRHDWICRRSEVFKDRLHAYIPVRGRLRWIEGEAKNSPRHNFSWVVWGPSGQLPAPRLVL